MHPKLLFRTSPPSEGSPPWTGIAFLHPIDSDDLAEDLKRTYPNGRTLRERKHMAIIDFFASELQQMQQARGAVSPAAIGRLPVYAAAPPALHRQLDDRISRNSQSPASSTCSVVPADPPVQAGTLGGAGPAEAVPVGAQQFVFSAADGKTMQAKTKRKMTVDEKTAYKETRRRGACSKCKRQKGKCTHRFEEATGGEVQVVVVDENGKRSASVEIDTDRDRKVVKTEHNTDTDTKISQPRGNEFTVVNRAEVMAPNQPQRIQSEGIKTEEVEAGVGEEDMKGQVEAGWTRMS